MCVYVCLSLHTCVGVRPPLGVCGPGWGSLWGTDPHLSAVSSINQWSALISRRGDPLVFHVEPASYRGASSSSWFGVTSQEGWHPADQPRVPLETRCKSGQRGGILGENHGGVKGARPAQDMAPSAWDDSTAKHLFPCKTSTSALSHKPTGSFNYSLA